MRIHLNLPCASASASTSSSTPSSSLLASAPAPLTALTPNGELILIELQGALEIENQDPSGGQILGTISFEPTRSDRPVLMISHHRLEGKFVNLVRPLAVLEKKVRPDRQDRDAGTGILVDVVNGKRRNLEDAEPVGMVKRAKQADGEEDAIARSSSPPPGPKARDALDFSSSPPRQTPIKPRTVTRATDLKKIDENGVLEQQDGITAQDVSRGEEGKDGEEEDEEEPQTAVYYDVVNVIKRKILFSKRPEPIVRLSASTSTPSGTKT